MNFTKEQIDKILDLYAPRMSGANRNIIKEFYVNRQSKSKINEISITNGISRQRVSDLLKLFLGYYQKHTAIQANLKPAVAFLTEETLNVLKDKGNTNINIVSVSNKIDNPIVKEEQNG